MKTTEKKTDTVQTLSQEQDDSKSVETTLDFYQPREGTGASYVTNLPKQPLSSIQFSSVQFSCSVVSNSLRPHEFQHARPPCPSPTPESWTVKKADLRRIDAFKLCCWRRLLRVPWTARRSNQSILKEISPGCSLQALMLKLKLQYFGHLMRKADSLEKTQMLGGIGGRRRRG